uniref:Uncharacterized protein n=1 Tax=Panagrolaimus sp. PS1159 TaxID=55785 RepID=A0AC35G3G0_9BILA
MALLIQWWWILLLFCSITSILAEKQNEQILVEEGLILSSEKPSKNILPPETPPKILETSLENDEIEKSAFLTNFRKKRQISDGNENIVAVEENAEAALPPNVTVEPFYSSSQTFQTPTENNNFDTKWAAGSDLSKSTIKPEFVQLNASESDNNGLNTPIETIDIPKDEILSTTSSTDENSTIASTESVATSSIYPSSTTSKTLIIEEKATTIDNEKPARGDIPEITPSKSSEPSETTIPMPGTTENKDENISTTPEITKEILEESFSENRTSITNFTTAIPPTSEIIEEPFIEKRPAHSDNNDTTTSTFTSTTEETLPKSQGSTVTEEISTTTSSATISSDATMKDRITTTQIEAATTSEGLEDTMTTITPIISTTTASTQIKVTESIITKIPTSTVPKINPTLATEDTTSKTPQVDSITDNLPSTSTEKPSTTISILEALLVNDTNIPTTTDELLKTTLETDSPTSESATTISQSNVITADNLSPKTTEYPVDKIPTTVTPSQETTSFEVFSNNTSTVSSVLTTNINLIADTVSTQSVSATTSSAFDDTTSQPLTTSSELTTTSESPIDNESTITPEETLSSTDLSNDGITVSSTTDSPDSSLTSENENVTTISAEIENVQQGLGEVENLLLSSKSTKTSTTTSSPATTATTVESLDDNTITIGTSTTTKKSESVTMLPTSESTSQGPTTTVVSSTTSSTQSTSFADDVTVEGTESAEKLLTSETAIPTDSFAATFETTSETKEDTVSSQTTVSQTIAETMISKDTTISTTEMIDKVTTSPDTTSPIQTSTIADLNDIGTSEASNTSSQSLSGAIQELKLHDDPAEASNQCNEDWGDEASGFDEGFDTTTTTPRPSLKFTTPEEEEDNRVGDDDDDDRGQSAGIGFQPPTTTAQPYNSPLQNQFEVTSTTSRPEFARDGFAQTFTNTADFGDSLILPYTENFFGPKASASSSSNTDDSTQRAYQYHRHDIPLETHSHQNLHGIDYRITDKNNNNLLFAGPKGDKGDPGPPGVCPSDCAGFYSVSPSQQQQQQHQPYSKLSDEDIERIANHPSLKEIRDNRRTTALPEYNPRVHQYSSTKGQKGERGEPGPMGPPGQPGQPGASYPSSSASSQQSGSGGGIVSVFPTSTELFASHRSIQEGQLAFSTSSQELYIRVRNGFKIVKLEGFMPTIDQRPPVPIEALSSTKDDHLAYWLNDDGDVSGEHEPCVSRRSVDNNKFVVTAPVDEYRPPPSVTQSYEPEIRTLAPPRRIEPPPREDIDYQLRLRHQQQQRDQQLRDQQLREQQIREQQQRDQQQPHGYPQNQRHYSRANPQDKVLHLIALNAPVNGKMGGIRGADLQCYQHARQSGYRTTFRAFLSSNVQDLRDLVHYADNDTIVVNSRGEKLFDTWSHIFNPTTSPYNAPIYSFNQKNIFDEKQQWQDRYIWHGSDESGRRLEQNFCEFWRTNDQYAHGMASAVERGRPLITDAEPISCHRHLIVLCVENMSKYNVDVRLGQRKRRKY